MAAVTNHCPILPDGYNPLRGIAKYSSDSPGKAVGLLGTCASLSGKVLPSTKAVNLSKAGSVILDTADGFGIPRSVLSGYKTALSATGIKHAWNNYWKDRRVEVSVVFKAFWRFVVNLADFVSDLTDGIRFLRVASVLSLSPPIKVLTEAIGGVATCVGGVNGIVSVACDMTEPDQTEALDRQNMCRLAASIARFALGVLTVVGLAIGIAFSADLMLLLAAAFFIGDVAAYLMQDARGGQ